MLAIFLLSLAAPLLTPPARAAEPAVDCSTTDLPQMDLNACAYQSYQAADKDLNLVYGKLAAQNDAAGKALLKKAENAWIAYRDSECAFEADAFRGGSMAPMIEGGCLAVVTKARTATLSQSLQDREPH